MVGGGCYSRATHGGRAWLLGWTGLVGGWVAGGGRRRRSGCRVACACGDQLRDGSRERASKAPTSVRRLLAVSDQKSSIWNLGYETHASPSGPFALEPPSRRPRRCFAAAEKANTANCPSSACVCQLPAPPSPPSPNTTTPSSTHAPRGRCPPWPPTLQRWPSCWRPAWTPARAAKVSVYAPPLLSPPCCCSSTMPCCAVPCHAVLCYALLCSLLTTIHSRGRHSTGTEQAGLLPEPPPDRRERCLPLHRPPRQRPLLQEPHQAPLGQRGWRPPAARERGQCYQERADRPHGQRAAEPAGPAR